LPVTLLKSKLRSSNPFWNASVTNENHHQIAAKIAHFDRHKLEIIGWKFTKFVHDVAGLLPLNLLKANL